MVGGFVGSSMGRATTLRFDFFAVDADTDSFVDDFAEAFAAIVSSTVGEELADPDRTMGAHASGA